MGIRLKFPNEAIYCMCILVSDPRGTSKRLDDWLPNWLTTRPSARTNISLGRSRGKGQGTTVGRSKPRKIDIKHPEKALPHPPPFVQPQPQQVLERFMGFVEGIEGDTAFLKFKGENGDLLDGSYSLEELARLGLKEGDAFECFTVIRDGVPDVEIRPLPHFNRELPELEEKGRRLDALLAKDDLCGED